MTSIYQVCICIYILTDSQCQSSHDITLLLILPTDLQTHGWKKSEGCLQVVWEVPENVARVNARLEFAFDGCNCKATGCATG